MTAGSLYINGTWVAGSGEEMTSQNPATGEVIWSGYQANRHDVSSAISAARYAFSSWKTTAFKERLAFLAAFSARVDERKQELAELIAMETGKILWDATGEAAGTAGKLALSVKAYEERTADRATPMQGITAALRHKPHGVMAVYGPYNFPAHLPNGHIIPALLAGNTVVFKPSEQTPAVGEWMIRQWDAVGLPDGVINLVQGEKSTGVALAESSIDGVLFTGSSSTGISLHRQFAGRPEILLALELGGNNPIIVDDITDIRAAAYEIIQSAYTGSGQRCTCARRLIITEGPWQSALIKELSAAVSSIVVGAYTDKPEPFMGPLISNNEAEKLLSAQQFLLDHGGKSLVMMSRLRTGLPFLSPALIDVTDCTERPDIEWFGPLLQVIRVTDFDAAIAEANNTRYGLSAGLLCNDRAKFERVLHDVRAGIINWNRQTTGASGMSPFGGVGCSGNHHPAGYYAADYCAYPIASMENDALQLPANLVPGISL